MIQRIDISISDLFTAGVEMNMYRTALKYAEMFDLRSVDEYEKRSRLFDSLKARCEAKGVKVEDVKWDPVMHQYVNAMLNFKKEKHKAFCKNFMPSYKQASAEYDAIFSSCDNEKINEDYKTFCIKYKPFINVASVLAHEVKDDEDYPEVIEISVIAKKFIEDINEHIVEVQKKILLEQQKRADAVQMIQPVEGHNLDPQQVNCILEDAHNHLVIAGAGTGKTTTIVGYVKYLIKSEICKPDEILMLSFTNKSAEEMKLRIKKETGTDMDVFTFHKLGVQIISGVEGKKCSVYSANVAEFAKQSISKHLEDENYLKALVAYCMFSPSKAVSEFDFANKNEYDEYIRNSEPVTIKGERVKSYCELEIANFLYSNGIKYTYEKVYEYDLADKNYAGYYPDFYLDDYDIYLEFFAINKHGQVPDWFTAEKGKTPSQTYNDKIIWKRKIHKHYGTTLVEVSYADKQCGRLLENLKDKLEAHEVNFYPKSDEELWNDIKHENNAVMSNVVNIVSLIISLIKANNYNLDQMIEKNIFLKFIPVLKLAKPVYDEYEKMLHKSGQIDFNDMIHHAADYVAHGKCTHNYKYVIVDEYQDMSEARYHLLNEMRMKSDFKLFCVGDDWQSIYRFAGSDVSYILNFEKYWGKTVISKIETTYRFGEKLIQITGQYIMKNQAQIQKSLKSNTVERDFPLGFIEAYTDKLLIKFMTDRVRKLEKDSTVYFIGRYVSDKKMFDDSEFEQLPDNAISLPKRPDLKMEFITVHKSKGLQADYVFILNNSNDIKGFPSRIQDDPIVQLLLKNSDSYPFAEERRLYYVAMTRAKKKVWLLIPQNKTGIFANELKAAYSEIIKRNESQAAMTEHNPRICPLCGGKLVYRNGKYGAFYGCSNCKFGCRYTEQIKK
mgnify:CR=1 FL=1